MTRLWQILAFLMLALMVPASACCQLEKLGSGKECCSCGGDEHNAPAQPEACPSATIAHSQVPAQVSLPTMQMMELVNVINEMVRLNELAAVEVSPLPSMTTAPPQLRTMWVFATRAALPARAPTEL